MTIGLVVALATVPLGGCDIHRKATQVVALLQRPDFGTASRNRVKDAKDDRTWEVMVEARSPARWHHANLALTGQIARSCPDGEPYAVLQQSPGGDDYTREYPEGTVFSQTIRCSAPYPMEKLVSMDAPRYDRVISVGEAFDHRRHRRTWVAYSEYAPKDDVLRSAIGREVLDVAEACGGGVAVHDILVGDFAQDYQGHRNGTLTIAIDITCPDGASVPPLLERDQLPPGLRKRA